MRHGSAVVLALALLAPVGAGAAGDVGRVKVVKGSVTIQRSDGSLPATVATEDEVAEPRNRRVEVTVR